MIKNTHLLLLAMALGGFTNPTLAAPIEHIGDRYIMHVSEMELTGEESLLDVLMMCPEVLTMDGNNIIGGDPFANLYGQFVIRIDNQEYGLDYATLLHHFKAREIESIKVCQNSEVMKGCSSLKKVIDITLRKGENGVSGRVGLFGDTYGGGKGIVSVLSQQDKLRILSHVEGNMQRTSNNDLGSYAGDGSSLINHYSHEGAKMNILWTPTEKDMLEVDVTQTYTRNHFTGTPADYVRAYHLQADYTRLLGDKGASSLHWVPRISAITAEMRQMPVRHLIATTPPIRLWWWNMPLRSSLRISGLQLVSRADCLSRKTVWPITSTTPTIRIYMRSWIIPSANGASWWATDSAPSISVRSRLLQKRTGSTVPTTIATR